MGDRHVTPRVYKSGSEKRKIHDEKCKKEEEVLSKTRKISSFFSVSDKSATEIVEVDPNSPARSDSATPDGTLCLASSCSDSAPGGERGNPNLEKDVGKWLNLTEEEIEHWIDNGPGELHHCSEEAFQKFSTSQERSDISTSRKCTKSLFYRNLHNEQVFRSWLCFSPNTGKLYCFPCKIMRSEVSSFSGEGFSNWKRAQEKLSQHETSKAHLASSLSVSSRARKTGLEQMLNDEEHQAARYWRDVLKRVVSAITFLSQRGLAFRGQDEIFGSSKNGNFLGVLELIAEYDPFLARHIEVHGNKKSGHTNYLSKTTCDELVDIMAEKILEQITKRIHKAKYYSISVDSSPDEANVDQLTVVIRYLEGVIPVERFLTFIPNCGHTGQQMVDALLEFLKEHDILFENCRGQSYDNARNMSGKYKGMQALILNLNPYAFFVPCCAHSMNLIAKSAANTCPIAIEFFNFLQNLFNFFTKSTGRFRLLNENLTKTTHKYTLKNLSDTRWSCRADAVKALLYGYSEIKSTLMAIAENLEEKDLVRNEASCLQGKMSRLETAIYTQFWHDILERFDATSKFLQNSSTLLKPAVQSLYSLIDYVESKRAVFDEYEKAAKQISGSESYQNVRSRVKNVRLSEPSQAKSDEPFVEQTPKDKFKANAFYPVLNQFKACLTERIASYKQVCDLFAFLSDLDTSPTELMNGARKLVEAYPKDLEPDLTNELIQLVSFAKQRDKPHEQPIESWLYDFISRNDMRSSFPNAEVALRIYLSIMVSNASGERSFSKMKIIKNRLRTSMSNDKLVNLTLLSSENDILEEVSSDAVIDTFLQRKNRKRFI